MTVRVPPGAGHATWALDELRALLAERLDEVERGDVVDATAGEIFDEVMRDEAQG